MYPQSFKKLIDNFSALPSIGPKMAERLVLFLFKQDDNILNEFSLNLGEFKKNLHYCKKCHNLAEQDLCLICRDSTRNQQLLCVVEDALDIFAIEKTKKYNGLYHVLGSILGLTKKGQESQLNLTSLENRILSEKITEVIIATNPTTEGDATALYIARALKEKNISITRLARGLSTGADIEYADELTLGSALTNRRIL